MILGTVQIHLDPLVTTHRSSNIAPPAAHLKIEIQIPITLTQINEKNHTCKQKRLTVLKEKRKEIIKVNREEV